MSTNPDQLKVWIDQDLCTGDAICVEIAEDVFVMDGPLAFVKENGVTLDAGFNGLARVPLGQEAVVIEAAEECPGECIFIEHPAIES